LIREIAVKFLVTGGCGFIGSHLVDAVIAHGHTVRILDDLSTGTLDYMPPAPAPVEFFQADVADPDAVNEVMRGMDGCFHLAAIASVERSNKDWIETHRTNLTGTITVFEAARRQGSLPVVYASSAAVYGNNIDVPFTESSRTVPLSAYGADKLGCELHGAVAAHIHNVPNVGLRFFNVYGPRQDPNSPYSGVITIFGNRMMSGLPITINGDGSCSRDFIFVTDVVRALRLAMEYPIVAPREAFKASVFNVCTGHGTSIITLADEMGKLFGGLAINFGPPRPGDPPLSVGDPRNANLRLGFRATTHLATGLATTFGLDKGLACHGASGTYTRRGEFGHQ
jgi:UDP-glucose 4-epimerase